MLDFFENSIKPFLLIRIYFSIFCYQRLQKYVVFLLICRATILENSSKFTRAPSMTNVPAYTKSQRNLLLQQLIVTSWTRFTDWIGQLDLCRLSIQSMHRFFGRVDILEAASYSHSNTIKQAN